MINILSYWLLKLMEEVSTISIKNITMYVDNVVNENLWEPQLLKKIFK